MSATIFLDTSRLRPLLSNSIIEDSQEAILAAHNLLTNRTGPGSEFLGWLDLPNTARSLSPMIKQAANSIKANSDALVVIGIGGSYLGARATIEALSNSFYNQYQNTTKIFYAGHNLSSTYHAELLDVLEAMDFSINIISKSGATTESAIAFRLCKELLERKYGFVEARKRIFATTDAQKGALRALANQEGYVSFVIPDDVGGRYSVLTPAGLLPMAVAGIDIDKLIQGAAQARTDLAPPNSSNPCYRYAALRNILYQKGKRVELLAAFDPGLQSFAEWWKQLFGESEGKDGKGLFPATAIFSTDLHSLGQYIQEGSDILFETILKVDRSRRQILIPDAQEDLDQLNYLAGKGMDYVNDCALRGTVQAHTEGSVPNILLTLPELTAYSLGYLFYFMEKACAISAYILGVNPFNQPGVEAYKKNMFALLGKP